MTLVLRFNNDGGWSYDICTCITCLIESETGARLVGLRCLFSATLTREIGLTHLVTASRELLGRRLCNSVRQFGWTEVSLVRIIERLVLIRVDTVLKLGFHIKLCRMLKRGVIYVVTEDVKSCIDNET